jgi:dimethylsulfone monooxygenase
MTFDAVSESDPRPPAHPPARPPLVTEDHFMLGLFASNFSGGMCWTTAEGALMPTWDNQVALATMADQAGFEAVIAPSRWKGFPGVSDHNGTVIETLTWAAGLAAVTEYTTIVPTVLTAFVHPLIAAKQAVTIDLISRGRLGLNLVAGWSPNDVEIFNAELLSHDDRYAQTSEWMTFVKKLWQEESEFDFNGDFYRSTAAIAKPQPLQKPSPVILNAGGSERGLEFIAEHADVAFTIFKDLEDLEGKVPHIRKRVRDLAQREVKVMTSMTIVCRDTEAEARSHLDYCINEKGDREAALTWATGLAAEAKTYSEEDWATLNRTLDRAVAGHQTPQAIGTPEQAAEMLCQVAALGVDGTTISFLTDWEDELERFIGEVVPLLEQAGVRKPFVKPGAGRADALGRTANT